MQHRSRPDRRPPDEPSDHRERIADTEMPTARSLERDAPTPAELTGSPPGVAPLGGERADNGND